MKGRKSWRLMPLLVELGRRAGWRWRPPPRPWRTGPRTAGPGSWRRRCRSPAPRRSTGAGLSAAIRSAAGAIGSSPLAWPKRGLADTAVSPLRQASISRWISGHEGVEVDALLLLDRRDLEEQVEQHRLAAADRPVEVDPARDGLLLEEGQVSALAASSSASSRARHGDPRRLGRRRARCQALVEALLIEALQGGHAGSYRMARPFREAGLFPRASFGWSRQSQLRYGHASGVVRAANADTGPRT